MFRFFNVTSLTVTLTLSLTVTLTLYKTQMGYNQHFTYITSLLFLLSPFTNFNNLASIKSLIYFLILVE